jgi:peptidoglycan/LPS O-acetylase OafA/YrhL
VTAVFSWPRLLKLLALNRSSDLHAGRLVSIDALRGVAVLAVLVVHLPFSWSLAPTRPGEALVSAVFPPVAGAVTDYGRFGVHLFLVISGFAIHMRWARVPGEDHAVDFFSFWRRRLLRLYPPYFIALLGSLTGLFVVFGLHGRSSDLAGMVGYRSLEQFGADLALLLTLTQNFSDASQRIGNGPFWTLALEEQLYAFYFLMLLIRRRLGWMTTLAVVLTTTLAWRCLPFVVAVGDHWYALGPSRWIEWVLGALAVEAYLGRVALPEWARSGRIGLLLLAAAVAINLPGVPWLAPVTVLIGDMIFGAAFFILVNSLVGTERAGRLTSRIVTPLAAVGLFSYSLYLIHEPAIVAGKQLILRAGLAPGLVQGAIVIVFRVTLAIVAAYVFYRIFETWAIRASRRARQSVSAAAGASGAAGP